MENQGLLFIPDISGFTRFVTETEIDHSRRIIEELLDAVIDANHIDLGVSEIEGDAVLFFRFGPCPPLHDLCGQVEGMFRAFHERLASYELRRYCQCRACVSASDLTLKVITHYGEFTGYEVKAFNKLIGKDVIVAHQLLKNDIEENEYWLVTADLPAEDPQTRLPQWIRWSSGVKRTESRDVAFRYTPLSDLRADLSPAPIPDVDLSRMERAFSATREYDTHIIALFHATGDFTYRGRWQEGVERVEEVGHYLPRVGQRCRRVMEDGATNVYASSYAFRPDRIVFSETEEGEASVWYFTLEALETHRTRLTIDVFSKRGPLRRLRSRLFVQKNAQAALERSLLNLDGLVSELSVPLEY